ncbi:helix-turn-helix transcriptional regulator [Adlercreutzia sp. R25]|uniref:helix-turn-helix transcriptional regulator n=1 Tax=Adlercreutzia shanghongiae TaxID=3111773 RepID=UPI002DBD89E8|nr:helix-turn-helix transcriptional regulator [Adlercreutzia sp. R25]MEC4272453.1 helix-turn-helix transcriptional regulator [Adlercreutzia sp. R25]
MSSLNCSEVPEPSSRKLAAMRLSNGGWGFLIAWGMATIFTDTFSTNTEVSLGWFWLASMLGASVGLLLFFLLGRCLVDENGWRRLVLFAAAFMVLGTIILEMTVNIAAEHRPLLCVIAGFASSIGTAALTVAWGTHYSRLNMAAIERVSALSLFISFVCYGLVLALPRTIAFATVLAFPLLSVLCLKCASSIETPLKSKAREESGNFALRGFVRLGIGVAATTLVVSLYWSFVIAGAIPLESRTFSISVLSGSITALVLMGYLLRYSRSLNLGTLYRWTLPLIAIAFSFLLFEGAYWAIAATLIVFAAQALLNLVTFVYFAELAQSTGASPVRIFGLGRFFVEFGFLMGSLIAPAALGLTPYAGGTIQGVLLIALTTLTIAVMISIATQDRLAFTLGKREEHTNVSATSPSHLTSDTAADDRSGTDVFQAACNTISAKFGLTKRESEILPYLAQGYSLPYIRNELYISQSTIDTHVRHIYKKMDLHSKEEVITSVRQTVQQLTSIPK